MIGEAILQTRQCLILKSFSAVKNYIRNVPRIYGLPIWITSFNRQIQIRNAIQSCFLELALPIWSHEIVSDTPIYGADEF